MKDKKLNIRSYSWYQNGLSWAYVSERLINAFDELGHNTYVISTNGINESSFSDKNKMLSSIIELQNFGPGKKAIDLDWCYTVPQNFPKRFLSNSKKKCAIYNYETTIWPKYWAQYYNMVDCYFPSSDFSAEVFYKNGIPAEKIFVIPHGVDVNIFNPNIPHVALKTKKRFKFVSVVAPHYRKNIPLLLDAYCNAFTAKDDVCLVLKTKVYKHSDGMFDMQKNPKGRKAFEIVLGDIFKDLYKKYGKNMPEIELLNGHVESVASIYNACHCNITTTGAEGFYMPGLESMACGLLNIAPNYSGHLIYMNEDNSLLSKYSIRTATREEQYWGFDPNGKIGQADLNNFSELMMSAYNDYDELMKKFKPNMIKTVDKLSWKYAAQLIIDAATDNVPHYVPGTYVLPK